MLTDEENFTLTSTGSHKDFEVWCDQTKSEKCLGIFTRTARNIHKQRARTNSLDYCMFCQKTEEYMGRNNPNAKYAIDDGFMSNIDTPEKAYLLGWVASDGTIAKSSVTIAVRDYDVDVLKNIRRILNTTIPIKENAKLMVSLTINSTMFVNDCIKHLGLATYGHKSTLIKYPQHLEPQLHIYFIRGFFEGDGSVSLKNRVPRISIASNSESMLEGIKRYFGKGSIYICQQGNQWQVHKAQDVIDILKEIYNDETVPYMYRKYDKYCTVTEWVPSLQGSGTHIVFNSAQGDIRINKSRSDAILPTISDVHASGIDLHIIEKVKDFDTDVSLYTTGIKVQPPKGYYFILVGRSSISKSGYQLANGIGIIDENYIGEILVPLRNHTNEPIALPNRLVQLILVPKLQFDIVEVNSFDDTERGTGGFGSTG